MKSVIEERMRTLFATTEFGPPLPPNDEPHEWLLFDYDRVMIFRGEAIELLGRCTDELTGSALSRAGPSRDAVRRLIHRACQIANDEDADSAMSWLDGALSAEQGTWTISEPIRAIFNGPHLRVGGCTIGALDLTKSTLDAVERDRLLARFDAQMIATEVTAGDIETAKVLAKERFAEARAVLTFAQGHPVGVSSPFVAIGPENWMQTGQEGEHAFVLTNIQDMSGGLAFGLGALSDAVAVDETERTDWQRRIVGAVRWSARGSDSRWPSERLIAAMIALETLFIRDQSERDKGRLISDRLTARCLLKGMSKPEQAEWLRGLYRDRNAAVHEARSFVEDRDLPALEGLLDTALGWGVWHLAENHVPDSGACATYDEAHSPHK